MLKDHPRAAEQLVGMSSAKPTAVRGARSSGLAADSSARAGNGNDFLRDTTKARRRAQAQAEASELRRLGEALQAREQEVLRRVVARTEGSGRSFEGVVREGLERICTLATGAVASWMTSGSPETGLKAGRGGWHLFGWFASQQSAPLDEITRRCLYWRDAAADVLTDSAEHLDVSAPALAQAKTILQLTVDYTLVKMCEVFEAQRRHEGEQDARRRSP